MTTTYGMILQSITRRIDISRQDLEGSMLACVNFSDSDLSFVRAFGMIAPGSLFTGCRMVRIIANGAMMTGSDFANADLSEADLEWADLERAVFVQTRMDFANLEGANLIGTQFRGANLFGSRLAGANLHMGAVEEVGGGGASARDQAVADRKSIPRQRARWGDGGLVLAARAMHMAQNVARRAAASRLRLIAAAVR